MVHTIETDPLSPFGEAGTPPAEWTYRESLKKAMRRGEGMDSYVAAWVARASENAHRPFGHLPRFPEGQSLERTVRAYVNWGRWVWDCPLCKAAQCCTPNDPRAFCIECFNAGDGWWPVEFPDDYGRIVELLARRPEKQEQNWMPGETVAQLQLENLSIGIDPNLPELEWPNAERALALVRSHRAIEAEKRLELEA